MDVVKSLIGGAAVFSFLWFAVAIFYIMLPILIWLDARRIRKAVEIQNDLTRQLLRAYGHEPKA